MKLSRREIATRLITLSTVGFAIPIDAYAEAISQDRLWKKDEFEAMRAKDLEELKKFPDLPVLKQVHTIMIKPPYYGGNLPITYASVAAANGSIVLMESSPVEDLIDYVYGNLDKANYSIPTGARSTKNDRLLAEARIINLHLGSMTPMDIMEIHFNNNGDVIFRSKSMFAKSAENFKIGESETSGKKDRDFFFRWPVHS